MAEAAYGFGMRSFAIWVWIAALAVLSPSTSAAPLRVLVYHYNIDQHGFSASMGPGSVHGYMIPRTATTTATIGASGTITVNIIRAAGDGGLVVDAVEHVDHADRDQQTIRCAVYGNPQGVFCDQNLVMAGEQTSEVTAVLSYLGRRFYDPSLVDAKNHWHTQVEFNDGKGTVECDYTITKTEGDLLDLSLTRLLRDGGERSTTTGTIVYDPSMTLAVKAHLVTDESDTSGLGGSIIDFSLISDSFAKR